MMLSNFLREELFYHFPDLVEYKLMKSAVHDEDDSMIDDARLHLGTRMFFFRFRN